MRKLICSIILCFAIFLSYGCASKKYDERLNGIQKQISYLSDSYNKLSMKFGEIQDSMIVLQNSTNKDPITASQNEDETSLVQMKVQEERVTETEPLDKEAIIEVERYAQKNVVSEAEPMFPGLENQELAGKPGQVFELEGGDGYIKIEGGAMPKNALAKSKAQGKQPSDLVLTPQQFYQSAYDDYTRRDYDKAIKKFSNFLKLFPEHDLADNAVYWTGESYVGLGEYALALPEFQRIALEYPNGNKAPDALLMAGICFDKLKNSDNALDSWKKLVMLYPESMAAKKASKKLDNFHK